MANYTQGGGGEWEQRGGEGWGIKNSLSRIVESVKKIGSSWILSQGHRHESNSEGRSVIKVHEDEGGSHGVGGAAVTVGVDALTTMTPLSHLYHKHSQQERDKLPEEVCNPLLYAHILFLEAMNDDKEEEEAR